MYNHEGGYAEINSEETAVTKVSGDKDTGSVEAELNGQTEYTRYLNNGETDTVVFENIEPGTHEVTVNPRNGQEVDVAYEWQETFATEDPRIDLNGDGTGMFSITGYSAREKPLNSKMSPFPRAITQSMQPDLARGMTGNTITAITTPPKIPLSKTGMVRLLLNTPGVDAGDRTSIGIDSIDPQSTVDRNVSTAVAPVTTDFRYTVQSGLGPRKP